MAKFESKLMSHNTSDQKLQQFEEEIRSSINRLSLENRCDVPDFIIAAYLVNCFNAFVAATCQNGEWHSDRD